MKRLSATLILSFITAFAFSQVEDPVTWSFTAKKKTDNTYEVVLTAVLDHPWHLYSQNTEKGGPIPTKIKFNPNPLVTVPASKPVESGKLEKVKDENFGVTVSFYGDQVQFKQTVTVKGKIKTNIGGFVEYMVCNDQRCLPPAKKSFDIKLQ